jgi:TRAP-type C4-dicarboxylate transport system substrate-binding protein
LQRELWTDAFRSTRAIIFTITSIEGLQPANKGRQAPSSAARRFPAADTSAFFRTNARARQGRTCDVRHTASMPAANVDHHATTQQGGFMRKQLTHVALVILALAIGAVAPAASVNAAPVRLTYSIFFPPSHGQCKAAMAWAEEIAKRTNGAVQIDVFPTGTLTKPNQCFDGVVNGISDLGFSVFAYTRGRFPAMEALDLPLGYPDGMTATRAANAFYQKYRPAELDQVKVLYLTAHGPGLLHTQKPVHNRAELAGLKIRATGLSAKIVEALGAVPVAMPQNEAYEALQKGVVEGTFSPIETLKGWKQAEVIKSTTDCKGVGYTTAMFVVMNRDKWNSLPPDVQEIFEEVSAAWIDVHGAAWDADDEAGRDYTLSLGNQIIELTPAEGAAWRTAVKPIIDNYIANAKGKGLPGDDYVATLEALIAK